MSDEKRLSNVHLKRKSLDSSIITKRMSLEELKKTPFKSPKTPSRSIHEYSGEITIPEPFTLSESKKKIFNIYQDSPVQEPQPLQYKGTPTEFEPFNLSERVFKNTPKSTLEIEKEELDKLRSQPFKARPLNPKILKGELNGIPKVEVKSSTKPQPFSITPSNQNFKEEKETKKEKEFHFGLTNPETPRLSFRTKPKKEVVEEPENPFQVIPPNFEIIKGLDIVKRKPQKRNLDSSNDLQLSRTEPDPFQLESVERHKINEKMFKENLKKELNELQKSRCFKASPLPNLK